MVVRFVTTYRNHIRHERAGRVPEMTMTSPIRNQHPEDIKAAVRKRGKTLTQIGLDAGLAKSTCRVALQKPIPSANRAIAKFLGQAVHVLWPEWYEPNGARRHAKPKPKAAVQ